jgi:hypothetical protein
VVSPNPPLALKLRIDAPKNVCCGKPLDWMVHLPDENFSGMAPLAGQLVP